MGRAAGGALAAVLCAPAAAQAADYVVDPAGDDGATGDDAEPWATLQRAADEVGPGDRVIVRDGTYEGFELRTGGTASEPIEFLAEPGATIDRDHPGGEDGINLEGASHVILEGFTVEDTSRAGVRTVDCEGVTIRDVTADRNGVWGILTSFCDDLLIEENETSRSEVEHGIYVGNTSRDPVVVDNHVWGNELNGIHLNGDAHAGGEGVITGALVEGNVIYENGSGGGSAINADGLRDSVIANNAIYENEAAGISLYAMDGGDASANNTVAHNTVVVPAGARPALQMRDGATDNEIVNNIFLREDGGAEAVLASESSLPGLRADHNAGSARYQIGDGGAPIDLEAWREHTGEGENSIEAGPDELFADPGELDFRLSPDSPAAGAGADIPGVSDLDVEGEPRGECGGPDVGAFACAEGDPSADRASGEDGPRTTRSDPELPPGQADLPEGGCGGEPPSGAAIVIAAGLIGVGGRRAGVFAPEEPA